MKAFLKIEQELPLELQNCVLDCPLGVHQMVASPAALGRAAGDFSHDHVVAGASGNQLAGSPKV